MITERLSLECQTTDWPTRILAHWGSNSTQPPCVSRTCTAPPLVRVPPDFEWLLATAYLWLRDVVLRAATVLRVLVVCFVRVDLLATWDVAAFLWLDVVARTVVLGLGAAAYGASVSGL